MDSAVPLRRVLVTGASGAVGRSATSALRTRGHHVRTLDLLADPTSQDHFTGSITDPDLLHRATENMDTVIHLAATTDDADFLSQLLPNNITAVYHVLEQSRKNGVKRVILASSIQATGSVPHPKDRPLAIADGANPWNLYGVTKLFAEAAGMVYANNHNLEIIAVRIGWLPRNTHALAQIKDHAKSVFLSWDDAGRFYVAATEAPLTGYLCVYAMSRNAEPYFDLDTPRRLLNYHPQDYFPNGIPFTL